MVVPRHKTREWAHWLLGVRLSVADHYIGWLRRHSNLGVERKAQDAAGTLTAPGFLGYVIQDREGNASMLWLD